jgi:peptidoglycan/LPS O-acetylase OafA/YrhL
MSQSPIRYIPFLDALRAIAVLLVLVHHWMPHDSVLNAFSNGLMGVTLFFVLSGYLISKILFVQKSSGQSTGSVLKTFYVRRALRIFPVYYLVLILLFLLGDDLLKPDGLASYFLYLQNFRFAALEAFEWPNGHLWSLAVEEQFYLVWPLVLLVVPKKFLKRAICILIAIGPLSRVFGSLMLEHIALNGEMIHVLMPTTLDCFGIGTLLAYFEVYEKTRFERVVASKMVWLYTIASFLLYALFDLFVEGLVHDGSLRLLFSLFSIGVVILSLGPTINLKCKSRPFQPLLYFGKISYGVYLFHPYVMILFLYATNYLSSQSGTWYSEVSNVVSGYTVIRVFVVFLITFGISTLSWEIFERPINNLKHRALYKG